MGRLEAVNWRVDYTLSSSELKEVNEPTVQLKLQAQDPESGSTETTVVSVTADKFRVLLTGMNNSMQSIHLLFSIFKSVWMDRYILVLGSDYIFKSQTVMRTIQMIVQMIIQFC